MAKTTKATEATKASEEPMTTKATEATKASEEPMTTKATEATNESVESKVVNPMEDRVEITILPPTQEQEGKTVFISCNSYTAKAKYGEPIVVPRFVKAMLENQQMALADLKKSREKFTK